MKKTVKKVEEVQEVVSTPVDALPMDSTLINSDNIEAVEVPVEIVLEPTIEETKPVTTTGKTVPLSASGKVRLLNTNTNKIITGLIDQKLAQAQVSQFSHIQIVNEAEYAKGQNK